MQSREEQMNPCFLLRLPMYMKTILVLVTLLGLSPYLRVRAETASIGAKQAALFARLNVAEAWAVTRGDPNVLIGVIDSGFDYFHPDLKGQVLPGCYYEVSYQTEFYENLAHGTLVAGLIVAKEGNPDGIVGLAPRCRVLTASQGMIEHMLFKVQTAFMREHPKAPLSELQEEMMKQSDKLKSFGKDWVHFQVDGAAKSIRFLVDRGVRVINISGGLQRGLCASAEKWKALEESFVYAAEKQVVIVLSVGNNAARCEDYPGKPDTVIVAGASLLNDTRWEQESIMQGSKIKQGSNFGSRLTAMAPVENLWVCAPHEERFYSCDDGPMGSMKVKFKGTNEMRETGATSSAAPIISSLVALLFSACPTLDAKTAVRLVQQGCDDIGDPGYDILTGYGRVNFGKTLQLAQIAKDKSPSR